MKEPLEHRIHELLTEKGLTLAVGESCTGGLLGHRITNVAGSSTYFLGGVIAYAYDAKERLLGVDHLTLYEYGAVSEETALEMARGARQALRADIGVSITGISGPSGGLPDKPVGLTWVAVCTRSGEWTAEHVWGGDRDENKDASVKAALELLITALEKE